MLRSIALLGLLVLLPGAATAEPAAVFPLDALRPGVAGTGYTVFRGDSIAAFPVTIIDRLPGYETYDLIMVRGGGDELERAGISQGMSGSPVYVDGRFAGALAFTFGFAREPMALLTPAAALLAVGGAGGRAEGPGGLDRPAFLLGEGERAAAPAPGLPLAVGGLDPAALARLERDLQPRGLSLMPMGVTGGGAADAGGVGSAGGGADAGEALRPGAAVAIELLRGPVSAAAFGTVSHVAGGEVWAMGHPFLEEGPTELPLAAARVHGIVPSLSSSFKLATVTRPLGTWLRDERAGLYGRLGRAPDLLPLTVRLEGAGEPRTARFAMVRHRWLTALVSRLAVQGWLRGALGTSQEGRVELSLRLHPTGREAVLVEDGLAGEEVLTAPALWLEDVVDLLQRNPAGSLPLDSLALTVRWDPGGAPVILESLTLDRDAVRMGEDWTLRVRLRHRDEIANLAWRLPSRGLPAGDYHLHLAGGRDFDIWNAKRQPELYRFDGHERLLDVLAHLERRDRWVLWLETPGRDRVLGGRELRLPAAWERLLPPAAGTEGQGAPRRLVRRETRVADGEARGHLALPVIVLETPRRSAP
ncbi:MAG: hypothetical protein JW819_11950 [Candidatus Krumholzibacteriota bacterium]|nr:hypothetical protein [Candidatus Krumholzibacteriota bacterium]